MLFPTGQDAVDYLKSQIPPAETKGEMDLSPLREALFSVPDEAHPGKYEFEGKNGLKVSLELREADNRYDTVYLATRGFSKLKGSWRPILVIVDLKIEMGDFVHELKNTSSSPSVFWLPNMQGEEGDLSPDRVDIPNRRMFLFGKGGFLSRPLDLLAYFHELGHTETRSAEQIQTEKWTLPLRDKDNELDVDRHEAAYELQREKDANDWMVEHGHRLFTRLDIPPELIMEHINHAQLRSYYDLFRRRYIDTLNK